MEGNPLLRLESYGQSIWLDFIRRSLITSGQLKQYIEEDGVSGMTSNPNIFNKAISGSRDYDDAIRDLVLEGKSTEEMYDALTTEDVQRAADVFRAAYDRTDGDDGFVSLEVSPHLARKTEESIAEARRLFAALDRPNVFIKIPGTIEGVPAIQKCLSEGININITLLFGLPRYRQVAEAYISALEERAKRGEPIDNIHSVASFFLSRIDVLVDPMLEKIVKEGGPRAEIASRLHGQVAIASAKIAYQIYRGMFEGERFQKLKEKGARTQRVLWASTSTKNPAYSDVKYVEALIGSETINTLPLETLDAYRDHGDPAPRLEQGLDEARWVLDNLKEVGIDLDDVTARLVDEGIDKFNKPYDATMQSLQERRKEFEGEAAQRQVFHLGKYADAFEKRMADLEEENFGARLWRKDGSLWSDDPKEQQAIANALGWLHVAEKMDENLAELTAFAEEIRAAGFKHVLHLGMGGSSLAPMVFAQTFAPMEQGLPLAVLDTTDPATIASIAQRIPMEDTLFIVASKSGTTAETLAFADYFYAKVRDIKADAAGENFVAITDPATPLVKQAGERAYRRVFVNFADIGGRYSALSYFGLVPAALMGGNVREIVERALEMVHACAASVPLNEAPGVMLGAALGELAMNGRDKVTFLMPNTIGTLGMWLEQLLAESTGKQGTGLLPVAGEPVGAPDVYGDDRVFVQVRLQGVDNDELDERAKALREAGHPVIIIEMRGALDLGLEFFRWEVATATAGAILGINAFNQPNVQESKDNTDRLLQRVSEGQGLPEETPIQTEDSLSIYDEDAGSSLARTLNLFLSDSRVGDYVALLAYLTETPTVEEALQEMRTEIRDRTNLATTLGYGPRYLHSTGQFHKGGPNTGLFLMLTAKESQELPVPGEAYSFGALKHAQALGDLQALRKHGRRVMRIDLGDDLERGLAKVRGSLEQALQ